MAEDLEEEEDEEERQGPQGDMYVKYNACLHGRRQEDGSIAEQQPPLSVPFMKKFFKLAKSTCRQVPVLGRDSHINSNMSIAELVTIIQKDASAQSPAALL